MPPVHESEGTADGENDEPKPENEENLLVQDVQREQAHCVEFLRGLESTPGQYYRFHLHQLVNIINIINIICSRFHLRQLGRRSCG